MWGSIGVRRVGSFADKVFVIAIFDYRDCWKGVTFGIGEREEGEGFREAHADLVRGYGYGLHARFELGTEGEEKGRDLVGAEQPGAVNGQID